MRLGHFWGAYGGHTGFDVRKRYTQKKVDLMVRLVHADLFVPTRVIKEKGKLIMHQSVVELKQELTVKLVCVFNWIERPKIMK